MDFDDQFLRYFGNGDPSTLSPDAISAGIERMLVDFGLQNDPSRRFALWTLLYMFGAAPDLDVAFAAAADRDAARDFMAMMEQAEQ